MATGVSAWLGQLSSAFALGDVARVCNLFSPDAQWRDLVALGGTIATHEGVAGIAHFCRELGAVAIENVVVPGDGEALEGLFRFAGPNGPVGGYVRLVDGACATLLTALEDLAEHPEATGRNRWSGVVNDADGRNWSDILQDRRDGLGNDEQPYVLIVGAGQSGLALGARLQALRVPALLVDKHPRIGDQWRSRYKSLTLHDPVWYDHLPYMQYPANWPVYTPKDKMGDWLEIYAEAMELTVWTGTEMLAAERDDERGNWTVRVRRADGTEAVLQPTQLVLALGNAGYPSVPEIPGAETFAGTSYHSSQHPGGEGMAGQKVIVIGANNSAHDIAADLVEHGALPTMVQRSSTLVVRQQTIYEFLVKPLYSEDAVQAGIDTETADLIAVSLPMRALEDASKPAWQQIEAVDKPFYDALRARGFALDFAEDGAGLLLKYFRSASGYYIDVGASQMVADGRIALKSGVEIAAIDRDGVVMADGSHLDADVIIYATGFGSMEQWIAQLISPEVAERLGRCWGYGSGFKGDPGPWQGELRNMWKPTAQEGLWIMGGNLQQSRIFSKYLAQQLKARMEHVPLKIIEPISV